MILPVIGLLLSISQAGVPTALFTLISSKKENHLLQTCLKLCAVQFVVCLVFMHMFKTKLSIIQPYKYTILLFILVASISALLRSCHLGNQQAYITAFAQIYEEICRVSLLLIFYFSNKQITLHHIFNSMLAGEVVSCLYMYMKIEKNKKISYFPKEIFPYKEILSISIPVSTTQIIHSFSHFLEPLLYQHFLLKVGHSLTQIQESYGILSGQVLSLLMIPTFLNTAIYKIILPKMVQSSIKHTQKLFIQSTLICLLIGLPFSLLFFYFPNYCLGILYKNTTGAIYLKYISLPFLLFYLQTPMNAFLQASKKQGILLRNSIIEIMVSLILLVLFIPKYHQAALLISYLCGLVVHSILSFISTTRLLFFHDV